MACDPLKQNFKHFIADLLLQEFDGGSGNNWFLAIGKPTAWADDASPPPALDTVSTDTDFWREILGIKRITMDNVSFVIPRIDWSSGEVYDPYRDDVELFNEDDPQNFYVLVDNYRVYKCIDNNKGAPSINKPQHTTPEISLENDGYRWKFMYEITENQERFLTSDLMPVQYISRAAIEGSFTDSRQLQYVVQQSAVDGAIDFIEVTEQGDPFIGALPPNASQIVNNVSEGGTVFRLVANRLSTVDSFYNGYMLWITASTNPVLVGQQREIVAYDNSDGFAADFTIDSPFDDGGKGIPVGSDTQWAIVPKVVITGDPIEGEEAVALAKVDANKQITSIELTNRGRGYSFAEVTITPENPLGEDGGNAAQAKAVMSPPGGHGSNAVLEFGAREIMVFTSIDRDENGAFEDSNEFRQFALLLNPKLVSGEIAGTEGTLITRLLIEVPNRETDNFTESTFEVNADEWVIGTETHNAGQVYDFQSVPGTNKRAYLLLQNTVGDFNAGFDPVGEGLITVAEDYSQASGTKAVVLNYDRYVVDVPDQYRVTTVIGIVWNGVQPIGEATIPLDSIVSSVNAEGTVTGFGIVVSADFSEDGTSGTITLIDTRGEFQPGNEIQVSNLQGELFEDVAFVGDNPDVIMPSEILYRSGDLVYVQNLKPVTRNPGQREELRLVIRI